MLQLFFFTHIFGFFHQTLLKCDKIVNCSVNDRISKGRGRLLNCSVRVFLAKISAKFIKSQNFVKNVSKIAFFGPLALHLLELNTLKLRLYKSLAQKRAICSRAGVKSRLELEFGHFLQIQTRYLYKIRCLSPSN